MTIRDLLWCIALAAVVAWAMHHEREARRRYDELDRRLYNVDQDVHRHLYEVTSRLWTLEETTVRQEPKR